MIHSMVMVMLDNSKSRSVPPTRDAGARELSWPPSKALMTFRGSSRGDFGFLSKKLLQATIIRGCLQSWMPTPAERGGAGSSASSPSKASSAL